MNLKTITKTALGTLAVGALGVYFCYALLTTPANLPAQPRTKSGLEHKTAPIILSGKNNDNAPIAPNTVQRSAYQEICYKYGKENADMIARHEGLRLRAYDDTKGFRTVGIGFNLDREGARKDVESKGIGFDELYNKQIELTRDQAFDFFRKDMDTAEAISKHFLGDEVYEKLPQKAKGLIMDMAFMGPKLYKFQQLKKALTIQDYEWAAREIENSKWYSDVKNRGPDVAERMRSLSKK